MFGHCRKAGKSNLLQNHEAATDLEALLVHPLARLLHNQMLQHNFVKAAVERLLFLGGPGASTHSSTPGALSAETPLGFCSALHTSRRHPERSGRLTELFGVLHVLASSEQHHLLQAPQLPYCCQALSHDRG